MRTALLLLLEFIICFQRTTTFAVSTNVLRSQSLEARLRTYEALHTRVVLHPAVTDKFVVVHSNINGWGNNLPSYVTGFFLALYLDRVLFLDAKMYFAELQHLLDFNWRHEEERLGQFLASKSVDNVTFFSSRKHVGDISWFMNANFKAEFENVTFIEYSSSDYDMPFLQANTALHSFLHANFPTGEVFFPLAQYLFRLSVDNEEVVEAFSKAHFQQYNIGLQIRRQRHNNDWGEQIPLKTFCSLALLLKQQSGLDSSSVGIFLATDTPNEVLPTLKKCLGESSLSFAVSNSAIQDMKLLSMCDEVVVTFTSTFGTVASAWGGISPIHTTYGPHDDGTRPWFWKAITSEPCSWASQLFLNFSGASSEDKEKFKANPVWLQVAQCYTAHEQKIGAGGSG